MQTPNVSANHLAHPPREWRRQGTKQALRGTRSQMADAYHRYTFAVERSILTRGEVLDLMAVDQFVFKNTSCE